MSTGLGLGLMMGRRMVSDGAPYSALAIMCFGDRQMSLDTNDDQLKLKMAEDGPGNLQNHEFAHSVDFSSSVFQPLNHMES